MTESKCIAFAVELLDALSNYDIDKVRSMFDEVRDGVPVEVQFPKPEGFQYRPGVDASILVFHSSERNGEVRFDFEMPFAGDEFRPMMIRTSFKGSSENFSVTLVGVVPT